LSCFGTGFAWLKFRATPWKKPILEVVWVYYDVKIICEYKKQDLIIAAQNREWKRMKFLSVCILCILALVSSSCGSRGAPTALEEWAREKGKIRVLSTTAMIEDLVEKVGGERVSSLALIVGEIDPHSYELVKGDNEKFSLAQVVFYNGLGLEHGASLHCQLKEHGAAFSLGDLLLKKHPEQILYTERQVDPHIWMDISLWREVVDSIVEALASVDPEGASFYTSNAEQLKQTMKKEHERIYQELQSVPQEKRYIVTSHDAFNYFTRAYLATPEEVKNRSWQKRFDAPEGLAPEGQLSVSHIQEVITHLMRYDIHRVFPESNVSQDSLKKVVDACKQKGFRVTIAKEVLYGDSMGPCGSGASTYLGMIHHDASVLKIAWE
jgi:manganese/zinc/iron transport system substrate-binding protein